MNISPKLKRIALYCAISVLAYLGPEVFRTEAAAPHSNMRDFGFPHYVIEEQKESKQTLKGSIKIADGVTSL
jgi:hypothetical protein